MTKENFEKRYVQAKIDLERAEKALDNAAKENKELRARILVLTDAWESVAAQGAKQDIALYNAREELDRYKASVRHFRKTNYDLELKIQELEKVHQDEMHKLTDSLREAERKCVKAQNEILSTHGRVKAKDSESNQEICILKGQIQALHQIIDRLLKELMMT